MNFSITTLGTASAKPIVGQHQSAHVVNMHGRLFLIDCGEGAQFQLSKYGISKSRLDNILISHLHGDHLFGIFGLLSTMAMEGRVSPIYIYAPRDFSSMLKFFLAHFGEGVKFEINHIPLKSKDPEEIINLHNCHVWAFPLNHLIDCYGFKIIYHKMPRHEGQPEVFKSIAYCSDTAPFESEAEWVRGVDLLYHDSTYADDNEALAGKVHHSTARQAAQVAAEAGAGKLILGHFSSRYKDFGVLLAEAREVFPESYLAQEGKTFEVI